MFLKYTIKNTRIQFYVSSNNLIYTRHIQISAISFANRHCSILVRLFEEYNQNYSKPVRTQPTSHIRCINTQTQSFHGILKQVCHTRRARKRTRCANIWRLTGIRHASWLLRDVCTYICILCVFERICVRESAGVRVTFMSCNWMPHNMCVVACSMVMSACARKTERRCAHSGMVNIGIVLCDRKRMYCGCCEPLVIYIK